MTAIESQRAVAVPEQGNLVRVRDRYWVVESVRQSSRPVDPMSSNGWTRHHLVTLVPIDDKGSPAPLSVFWETEPGTEIRPQSELPDPGGGLDAPEVFAGFLDAVRWGAIASADPQAFQSPFRAGIDIEDYQLLPLVKALRMPRVTLLVADDVGLGKTVEAGLIAQELVLRNQANKILVVCPPSLCGKWQREMREQFGLSFEVVDTDHVRQLRRERGVAVNPFRSHPRLIVSMEWVKFESQMRWFDEFLPPDPNVFPRAFDLLIVDEAHRIAPSAVGRYARDSLRTMAMKRLAPHFEHRLFLTATPHNGYPESFQALLEMLDPNRFTKGVEPRQRDREAVIVRRLKSHLRTMLPDGDKRFPKRRIAAIEVEFPPEEQELFTLACSAGHLDDFPWEQYAHRGAPCAEGPVLELKEVGRASRATDVRVVCKACGANRVVHDAFGPEADAHLPRCRGRHPHLQRFDPACDQPTRALLLGASNAWFAVYRSALTIPTVSGAIAQKVAEHWDLLEDIEDRTEFDFIIKRPTKGAGEKPLRWLLRYDPHDVWTAISDRRDGDDTDTRTGTGDLHGPEWEAFTAAVPPQSDDFKVTALPVPSGFNMTLGHPVAVDRLREVQALCGFTRIDGPDEADPARIAPIWKGPQTWLPAAEVRGEGILITLPETRVEQWERDYRDSIRYQHLQQATRNWRTRRGLSPDDAAAPPPRFVLLHTLSHLLINQVALDCGYSTASIRERLYCREAGDPEGAPMAGVLLYTAAPDSEGTLGGLVALAEPVRLAAVLRDALDRAELCSTDPMCSDHHAGDLGDTLHNAACHACLFAPETSCEAGNRHLDRAAAVPILGHPQDAYFT